MACSGGTVRPPSFPTRQCVVPERLPEKPEPSECTDAERQETTKDWPASAARSAAWLRLYAVSGSSAVQVAAKECWDSGLIWSDPCQAPISLSHGFRDPKFELEESTAQGTRDARAEVGDDDHADIRGLVTAFHSSVAGLPRSSVGDHHADAHIVRSRIPLIGARASRDPCVVGSVVMMMLGE